MPPNNDPKLKKIKLKKQAVVQDIKAFEVKDEPYELETGGTIRIIPIGWFIVQLDANTFAAMKPEQFNKGYEFSPGNP